MREDFRQSIDGLVQSIPLDGSIIIGGDLNGHVGSSNVGYGTANGGHGFRDRNDIGESILDFATAFDLVITRKKNILIHNEVDSLDLK